MVHFEAEILHDDFSSVKDWGFLLSSRKINDLSRALKIGGLPDDFFCCNFLDLSHIYQQLKENA